MKWSCKIDWLTLTHRASYPMRFGEDMNRQNAIDIAHRCFREVFRRDVDIEFFKPNPFYMYALKEAVTGAILHIAADTVAQGVMLVLSGQALDKLTSPSETLMDARAYGWKCTRMDVAFDIIDSHASIRQSYEEYCKLAPHKPERKTAFVAGKNGDTFYIGARSSAKMVRLYDKGKQQKVEVDWIRAEIELKDHSAESAAYHAERYPAALGFEIAKLIDNPNDVFARICEDASEGDITVRSSKPKTRSNRLVWLLNSVMPAIRQLAVEERGEYVAFMRALLDMQDEVLGGYPLDDLLDADNEVN